METPENTKGAIRAVRLATAYALSAALFLVVLPCVVLSLGIALDHAVGVPRLPMDAARYMLGGAIVLFGLSWMLWTNVALVRIGGGHPQEAFGKELLPATVHLVKVGLFARTRNPMAFGQITVTEGLAIAIGSATGALLVVPAYAVLVMLYIRHWEEPGLLARFGAEYEQYRRDVPMLIPIGRRLRATEKPAAGSHPV